MPFAMYTTPSSRTIGGNSNSMHLFVDVKPPVAHCARHTEPLEPPSTNEALMRNNKIFNKTFQITSSANVFYP